MKIQQQTSIKLMLFTTHVYGKQVKDPERNNALMKVRAKHFKCTNVFAVNPAYLLPANKLPWLQWPRYELQLSFFIISEIYFTSKF